jgi:hypothetical protein
MVMNWKVFGSNGSWPNLRYYPGICLERLRHPRKTSIRIAGCWDQDFNPGPPEYGVLTVRPLRSTLLQVGQIFSLRHHG